MQGNGNPNQIQNIPIKASWGEVSTPVFCNGCRNLERAGLILQFPNDIFMFCAKCQAKGIQKWQEQNPASETLLNFDMHVEGPAMDAAISSAINTTLADYKIPEKDRNKLVEAIRTAIDGDKFYE